MSIVRSGADRSNGSHSCPHMTRSGPSRTPCLICHSVRDSPEGKAQLLRRLIDYCKRERESVSGAHIMTSSGRIIAGIALALFMFAAPVSAHATDWLAYSVDGSGKFGHGRGPNRAAAIGYAINWCGQPRCYLVAAVQARCTALAVSNHRGYWVGMGSAASSAAAIGYAIDWCSKSAPTHTCRITHSYCQ